MSANASFVDSEGLEVDTMTSPLKDQTVEGNSQPSLVFFHNRGKGVSKFLESTQLAFQHLLSTTQKQKGQNTPVHPQTLYPQR